MVGVAPTPLPAEPAGAPELGIEAEALPGQEPVYLAQQLTRGAVSRAEGAPSGVGWAVRTGSGHALGVDEFATVTGDTIGQQRIRGKRKAGVWEGILLAGIGTSLEAVALGYLAGGGTSSPTSEDWLWRGATFAAAGVFPLALCTLPSRANKDRERWTALYYTTPQIDPLITTYNTELRLKLGLPALVMPSSMSDTAPAALIPAAPGAPLQPEDAPALPPVDKLPEAEPAPGGK